MYAQIQNTVAVEVVSQEAFDTFNQTVQALFVVCPAGITVGYTYIGGAWTAPVAPTPAPVRLHPLTPMQFYLAFTPAERIAIKKSTDPEVMEFWATYQLAVQLNNPIDPNLASVQDGLAYLAQPAPGAGILASGRVAQILDGVPQ